MITIFAQAREKHLGRLDVAYRKLRDMMAAPDLCNAEWPPLKRAQEDMLEVITDILLLNNAEWEANRDEV